MLTLCVYFLAFSKFGEILESLHCQSNLILSGFLSFLGWSVKPFVPFLKILTSSSLLMAPPGARFCRMARYSVHLYHGRYDFQFISGPPTLVSVYISMFYSDMKLVWVVSGIRSCAPTQALFYLTAWAWNVIWEVGVQSTHEIPSPDGKTVPNHHLN